MKMTYFFFYARQRNVNFFRLELKVELERFEFLQLLLYLRFDFLPYHIGGGADLGTFFRRKRAERAQNGSERALFAEIFNAQFVERGSGRRSAYLAYA